MKQKLMQTRVPEPACDEAERRAAAAGISQAAWLRQLVLRETGFDGNGKKIPNENKGAK